MSVQRLLQTIFEETTREGIELILSPGEFVIYSETGESVCGYFDDTSRILACALGNVRWVEILTHEYAHFKQFQEEQYQFIEYNPYPFVDDWQRNQISLSDEELESHFQAIIACELDAEQRALFYLDRYSTGIDLKTYAKRANGYIVTYLFQKKHRTWVSGLDWTKCAVIPDKIYPSPADAVLTTHLEDFILAHAKSQK